MSEYYILNANGDPEPCDMMTWAIWMERGNRRIARSEKDGVVVSTVFLGLDHSFGGAVPILYETMISGGANDRYQEQYTNKEDAIAGHKKACELAGIIP